MIGSRRQGFRQAPAATRSARRCSAPRTICLPRATGGYAVDHVSLSVRAGEILGVYGLMGAGRSEFFECIMGRHPHARGAICHRRRAGGRARRRPGGSAAASR